MKYFFYLLLILVISCQNSPEKSVASEEMVAGIPDITILSEEIDWPWGLRALPTGDVLVTEKSGKLYRITPEGKLTSIGLSLEVSDDGQGAFFDVVLHPNFKKNNRVYLSYAKPKDTDKSTTAIATGRLEGDTILDLRDIFVAKPYGTTTRHYGGRMIFDDDGYLYLTVGDRGKRDENPQDLSNDCGKVHRMNDDGSVPRNNPFVGQSDVSQTIFTYGHRNPQGMDINPKTREIWTHEHGPQGGDEINILEAGKNYGWPVASFGENYGGGKFTELTEKEGMESPTWHWTPSIAPCGMDFIEDSRFSDLNGTLLSGSLKFRYIEQEKYSDKAVTDTTKLYPNIGRVRSITQDNNGEIYIAVESPGKIIRLE